MNEQHIIDQIQATKARMRELQENPTDDSHLDLVLLTHELDELEWDLSAVRHGDQPDYH